MATETSSRGELIDKVVKIRRCAAVVKGGRRFSFTALVVVGDGHGKVGWGYGKANEVPPSVEKAIKDGTRNMKEISMSGTTIPHVVQGQFGAASVVLVPAMPGTGVIAGNAVRHRLRGRRHPRHPHQEFSLQQPHQPGQSRDRRLAAAPLAG